MRKKKKQGRTARHVVRCPKCGSAAVLRPASEIYADASRKDRLYVCSGYPECRSYVGTYPGTIIPMGTPADGDLRNLRIRAHRRFDEVWRTGIMTRENSYRWMADAFGIPLRDAHIAMFGEYRCRELIRLCEAVLENRRRLQAGKGGDGREDDHVSAGAC